MAQTAGKRHYVNGGARFQAHMKERIDELRQHVHDELALPEHEQIPLNRLHKAVNSYIGEFRVRAKAREAAAAFHE